MFHKIQIEKGLNQIYLDLVTNGTSSSYFVYIIDTYGQIISFLVFLFYFFRSMLHFVTKKGVRLTLCCFAM